MNTTIFLSIYDHIAAVMPGSLEAIVKKGETASSNAFSYIIGGIIALLILGYLIYTLMHPEKF